MHRKTQEYKFKNRVNKYTFLNLYRNVENVFFISAYGNEMLF